MNGFPEKILLATDGSENTTLAARAAVDLAKNGGSASSPTRLDGG
jgi:nucleotide-binding universal stress UspA family protein